MSKRYDVIVLGSGNAGLAAAGVAKTAGKSVAVVESWDVGGTCAIRGCVPKKVLVAAAQALHQIALAPEHHIEVGDAKLDWAKLIARERTFVHGVPDDFANSLKNRGIDLIRGAARFTGKNTIDVDGHVFDAGKIVIATGSKPRDLPIPGAEHMVTSDDLLENPSLPDRLVFIGGGVIALEFGHVLARAGAKVTILEVAPRLLPRLDEDAVAQLHAESERIGIEIRTGVTVEAIEQAGNTLTVRYAHDGEKRTIETDRVANGAGRAPNVDDLDLDAGGIAHDGLRIEVDEGLRSTTNPDVYVAGDALATSPQLSPVATYEGRIAGENLVNGHDHRPEYGHIPSAVYAVPALASVGLTEDAAKDQGLDVDVKVSDMRDWRSARTYAETVAWSKVLIEKDTGRIVGAHLVGHGAEEVIHHLAFAMQHGVSAEALKSTVYGYPTFTSDVKHML